MADETQSLGAAGESCRYLLPPEILWAEPDATAVPSSPTKSKIGRKQTSIDREAADVWGVGAIVFELATGRVAGEFFVVVWCWYISYISRTAE